MSRFYSIKTIASKHCTDQKKIFVRRFTLKESVLKIYWAIILIGKHFTQSRLDKQDGSPLLANHYP
ncbi:MAG: 4'-phosphopantetheinyl transferase superfamily protein [Microcystis panniformis Mp_MB_F_20051200_S9]|uniref:4'-phosphopantetheinyl transferase superfamily protein n=1 Tax=Microcystis panniformis Mp_MB_F_20051200_S9 TaxID=2486223 RepID=A0A552PZN3_9CHRO|nr:MAG: 4'-phosphopantetheinyl transferase superfamily protein [Microcystis panniformis Mp_GB_SS_20050300_S99]TRV50530.1 MAG: 4'-phosphopantetheinyl transferase superfamily protein [Microcystis panniformis Mp_GB_SS_20050300_S99D]TRV50540.1 MAG: 4'-phosphopantetheinyl transferase superfamily protein [Microcystis panniformis Mp_MB_F_20080800_S26D]TRV59352.1 MAG: 4'-phosphopantetheinyl transferase superfamily protein [Microcystis panniformis Mp_MB_F_20051200_S9D]TRV59568.1 MAG: 4'-phosphopantethei